MAQPAAERRHQAAGAHRLGIGQVLAEKLAGHVRRASAGSGAGALILDDPGGARVRGRRGLLQLQAALPALGVGAGAATVAALAGAVDGRVLLRPASRSRAGFFWAARLRAAAHGRLARAASSRAAISTSSAWCRACRRSASAACASSSRSNRRPRRAPAAEAAALLVSQRRAGGAARAPRAARCTRASAGCSRCACAGPHGNVNPNGFDYEAWLLERGIGATGYVRQRGEQRQLGRAQQRSGPGRKSARSGARALPAALGATPAAGHPRRARGRRPARDLAPRSGGFSTAPASRT